MRSADTDVTDPSSSGVVRALNAVSRTLAGMPS